METIQMYSKEAYDLLKDQLEQCQRVSAERNDELRTIKNKMKSYLSEHYEDLLGHAVEIAEMLNITVTKTVDVEINVTHSFQLEVEIGEEFDEGDFYFDADSYDKKVEDHSFSVIWLTVDGERS